MSTSSLNGVVDPNEPQYWELAYIVWPIRLDENGDVVKTGPAEIVDIRDSGVDNVDYEKLSDYWQVVD